MNSKILLIYTGGTIGMAKNYNNGTLRPFDFNNLANQIPELQLLHVEIEQISFSKPIDSSDMKPQHWIQIAKIIQENYQDYHGFVVLHGTDTMAYTASALSFMIQNINKPIIFTGSQLPIGDLRTDAKENLITSIYYASQNQNSNGAKIREVCIYFEYKLYRANRTTKINAEHFDAFASPNYPILGESGVRLEVKEKFLLPQNNQAVEFNLSLNSNVGLIKLFPGMPESFVKNCLENNQSQALIIEAFGAGNVFTDAWFLQILEKKIKQEQKIIVKTQCAGGMVDLGKYQTSKALQNFGAISAKDLTTEAAIAKAIYLLPLTSSYNEFKQHYEQNFVGELTVL